MAFGLFKRVEEPKVASPIEQQKEPVTGLFSSFKNLFKKKVTAVVEKKESENPGALKLSNIMNLSPEFVIKTFVINADDRKLFETELDDNREKNGEGKAQIMLLYKLYKEDILPLGEEDQKELTALFRGDINLEELVHVIPSQNSDDKPTEDQETDPRFQFNRFMEEKKASENNNTQPLVSTKGNTAVLENKPAPSEQEPAVQSYGTMQFEKEIERIDNEVLEKTHVVQDFKSLSEARKFFNNVSEYLEFIDVSRAKWEILSIYAGQLTEIESIIRAISEDYRGDDKQIVQMQKAFAFKSQIMEEKDKKISDLESRFLQRGRDKNFILKDYTELQTLLTSEEENLTEQEALKIANDARKNIVEYFFPGDEDMPSQEVKEEDYNRIELQQDKIQINE
ncbi:MAG: hypothetical protein ACK4NC_06265 [Candidatus Gracilibacteria bacterium]